MVTEGKFDMMTVAATVRITPDMLFKGGTLNGTLAAGPLQAGGVIRSTAEIGQGLSLINNGDCKVLVGAAVNTKGFPLTITTSGFFIPNVTSGSATIGRSLALAASGDMMRALVDFNELAAAAVS